MFVWSGFKRIEETLEITGVDNCFWSFVVKREIG